MSNTAIVSVAQAIQQWTADDQALIRRMVVARDASDQEFKIFLYQAAQYGLNPLLKECYGVRYKTGQPMACVVAIGGFLNIAHRADTAGQTYYGGADVDCLYDNNGKLTGAIATVWRKDSQHPTIVRVKFSEYNTSENTWKGKPETMIKKVALAQALRIAFNISGLYLPEEMGSSDDTIDVEYSVVETASTQGNGSEPTPARAGKPLASTPPPRDVHDTEQADGYNRRATKAQYDDLKAVMELIGMTADQCRDVVKQKFDTETTRNLNYHQLADLIKYLRELILPENTADDGFEDI